MNRIKKLIFVLVVSLICTSCKQDYWCTCEGYGETTRGVVTATPDEIKTTCSPQLVTQTTGAGAEGWSCRYVPYAEK